MTEGTMKSCPICKLEDTLVEQEADYGERVTINCRRCGRFTITRTAESIAISMELNPKLSAWIRNRNEQGAEFAEINSKSLRDIQAGLPHYSPREKQVILLKNIEHLTQYPGQRVGLTYLDDFPLAWATGLEEFIYYITSLRDRGLLSADLAMGQCEVTITADGWDYLEQLEKNIEDRTQVFVAMSFSPDLKHIYEGPIFNAITKAGYKPYRVDAEPHSDRIDVKIIAEIKNSRFVVAEFTEQKHGVYFEAGYALGLGLPVIWCVKKDELDKAHFDTRQYNHIAWESTKDFEDQLFNFICAIIGKGKVR